MCMALLISLVLDMLASPTIQGMPSLPNTRLNRGARKLRIAREGPAQTDSKYASPSCSLEHQMSNKDSRLLWWHLV